MTAVVRGLTVTPPPRLVISDGSIEALKWLALVLMTGDHVNKYLFNETFPYLFEAGRAAMPLFVFVLGFNLARPGALERGAYLRTVKRLVWCGVLATPAFMAVGGLAYGWWPLNIMFTLAVITATLYLVDLGGPARLSIATGVVLLGASSVEFWWPAVALGIAAWFYCKRPSWTALLAALLACAALWFINGNFWALAAFPVVAAATRLDVRLPHLRWVFYAYYPLHLSALWLIRIPMSKAGYLLF